MPRTPGSAHRTLAHSKQYPLQEGMDGENALTAIIWLRGPKDVLTCNVDAAVSFAMYVVAIGEDVTMDSSL